MKRVLLHSQTDAFACVIDLDSSYLRHVTLRSEVEPRQDYGQRRPLRLSLPGPNHTFNTTRKTCNRYQEAPFATFMRYDFLHNAQTVQNASNEDVRYSPATSPNNSTQVPAKKEQAIVKICCFRNKGEPFSITQNSLVLISYSL